MHRSRFAKSNKGYVMTS